MRKTDLNERNTGEGWGGEGAEVTGEQLLFKHVCVCVREREKERERGREGREREHVCVRVRSEQRVNLKKSPLEK
jgi:hypothetical protein